MISELSIDSIRESLTNPRRAFGDLTELTESIRSSGVLQPVLARPVPKSPKTTKEYELVFGHRRLRAAVNAGLTVIPAMVRDLTDIEVLEAQLIENCQRSDIHPLEEAQGYHQLVSSKSGYDAARIAERVGKSVAYVYDRLKLLSLTSQAQALFLQGAITAGHAVILARLKPADQARAIGRPGDGPLLNREHLLFEPRDLKGQAKEALGGDTFSNKNLKPISVRELQAWVDKNVRFDADQVEPMLFPVTAETITQAREVEERLVAITYDYHVIPEAKQDGTRTYGPMSWKRADGTGKHKTCDHSVTGVIVVGVGRGQAFKVCIDKKKCSRHWGSEQRETKKRVSAATKGGKTGEDRYLIQRRKQEDQQRRDEAERKRWEKAAPAILKAVAEAVKKASAQASGLLAQIVLDAVTPYGVRRDADRGSLVPRGSTAEDLVRHAAFIVLTLEAMDNWNAPKAFPTRAKAFGIDTRKILDEVAPKPAAERACRKCGCTEKAACEGGCSWVKPDLCSACVGTAASKKKAKMAAA